MNDSDDPYLDPISHILQNKLGITDAEHLSRAETDISRARMEEIIRDPIPGSYDLDHLRSFHKKIFNDVYPWAGELRTVNITKGNSTFCFNQYIEQYARELFSQLKKEQFLQSLDRENFIERLIYYFGEINALHPFREGNGRTQRAFLAQLSRDVGYLLDWNLLGPKENINISINLMARNAAPAHRLFDRLIKPLDAKTTNWFPIR